LDLFIAVVVSAMQAEHEAEQQADVAAATDERSATLSELRALRREIAERKDMRQD
jgi:voltage-gated sodium channel